MACSTATLNEVHKQIHCAALGVEDYQIEDLHNRDYEIKKGHKVFYPRVVRFIKNCKRLMFIVEPVVEKKTWTYWPFTFEEWVYDESAMADEVTRMINKGVRLH